jgi:hypothetical protein
MTLALGARLFLGRVLVIVKETNSGALGAFSVGHVKLILRLKISTDKILEECINKLCDCVSSESCSEFKTLQLKTTAYLCPTPPPSCADPSPTTDE